jgi:hypothetical protein
MSVVFDGCFGKPPLGAISFGREDGIPVEVLVGPDAVAVFKTVCEMIVDGSLKEVNVSVPVG